MKRLLHIALLPCLVLSFALTGCDSADEGETPIAERLIGSWEVSAASVRVNTGMFGTIAVPVLDASDSESVTIAFDGDRFVFEVTGPIETEVEGVGTITILEAGETSINRGTYEIVEGDEQIRFTTTEINGQPVPVPASAEVSFELRGDNTLALIAENTPEGQDVIAFLLGEEFPSELLDSVEGGEATFTRTN